MKVARCCLNVCGFVQLKSELIMNQFSGQCGANKRFSSKKKKKKSHLHVAIPQCFHQSGVWCDCVSECVCVNSVFILAFDGVQSKHFLNT